MKENKNNEKVKKTVQVKLVRHKWPDEIAAEKAKNRRIILMILGATLFFMTGFSSAKVLDDSKAKTSQSNNKLNEVYDVMMNKWYFGKDLKTLNEVLMNQALKGMTSHEVDPYSGYMTKEETMELSSSLQGSVTGIGVEYVYVYGNEQSYIVNVFKGSPAEKAGLKAGDVLVKVDGKEVTGMNNDTLHKKILGKSGSKVVIQVKRENQYLDYEVIRGEVNNSVFGEVKGDVGILTITSFAENSGVLTDEYLKKFNEKRVKKLVIDLRGNGGGYVQAAIDIANHFLKKGSVVLYEEKRDGSLSTNKTSGKGEQYHYEDMVVLVDEKSASASEVLTATLKEYLDVKIVGTKTFGKGTVQVTQPFFDGSSLKYTIAQWLTPNKKKIHGKGINPDVEVQLNEAIKLSPISIDVTYKEDSVSQVAIFAQKQLLFLGYPVDRTDGYFSIKSAEALKQYQTNIGMEANGIINQDVMDALYSSVQLKWNQEKMELDTQLLKAMEVVNERKS